MLLSSLPLQAHHISRVVWEHFAPPKIKRFPTSSSCLPPFGEGGLPLTPVDLLLAHVLMGVAWAMLCKIQVSMHRSASRVILKQSRVLLSVFPCSRVCPV